MTSLLEAKAHTKRTEKAVLLIVVCRPIYPMTLLLLDIVLPSMS